MLAGRPMVLYGVAAGAVSGEDPPVSDYSATFLDHYERPRNLGDLGSPDAVAIVHDATCGDLLRLAVKLERGDRGAGAAASRIAAVRFKAYGCAATIAAASALTEMLAGRTLQEAAAIDQAAIVSALDGLPPRRLHAVGLALQALAELLRAGK